MDATTQQQYAETFHGLHRKGDPLILFNAWDVATAKASEHFSGRCDQ
jgi:2-methylisocitrate lyase-like PEP mutase family enzyme